MWEIDTERDALFISHANPDDNAFAIWLGVRLAAVGYEVWADVLSIRGGEDWARKLENALRERTRKVLLVCTAEGIKKQGVRNEITIATETARRIGDDAFIIPLRLENYESPFLVVQAQYIKEFEDSWAAGFAKLIKTLDDYCIPRKSDSEIGIWREIQQITGKRLSKHPETLVSNWLPLSLPRSLNYFRMAGPPASRSDFPFPIVPHSAGVISYATPQVFKEAMRYEILPKPLQIQSSVFLESGWRELAIPPYIAKNIVTELIRQSFESFVVARHLNRYELANGHTAWWGDIDVAPTSKFAFQWGKLKGSRLLQGASKKRELRWHLALSTRPLIEPFPHIRVIQHLVFTSDGRNTVPDVKKSHTLRKSFAKSWRNARWRDMLLACLSWLSDGGTSLNLPLGGEYVQVSLPPICVTSPVGIASDEELPENDEPIDYFDDELDADESEEDDKWET